MFIQNLNGNSMKKTETTTYLMQKDGGLWNRAQLHL